MTSQPRRVRATAREAMAFYADIPSRQAALDRHGVANAADLAVIGNEAHVAARLEQYLDAGATDITVTYSHIGGEADRRRTWTLLGELQHKHGRRRT